MPNGPYLWTVIYENGSRLVENVPSPCCYPEGAHLGMDHGFACVDRKHVVEILFSDDAGIERTRVRVVKGASPVLFRRHIIRNALGGNPERSVICVSGWQQGDEKTFLGILPNGSLVLTGDDGDLY